MNNMVLAFKVYFQYHISLMKCADSLQSTVSANTYRVRQKKWTPKVFRRFLSNHLGF